jgi:hypothetical protein
VEQERREQPGAVLAADAVDHHPALGRVCDGADRRGDVVLEVLEEDQVRVARRRRVIGRCRGGRLELGGDLLPLRVARLHERNVDDLDRQLAGRVLLALVVAAQVDDESDPVVDERAPPVVAEQPTLSARTTAPRRVSPPSLVGKPPRSRTLRQPSQTRSRVSGGNGC